MKKLIPNLLSVVISFFIAFLIFAFLSIDYALTSKLDMFQAVVSDLRQLSTLGTLIKILLLLFIVGLILLLICVTKFKNSDVYNDGFIHLLNYIILDCIVVIVYFFMFTIYLIYNQMLIPISLVLNVGICLIVGILLIVIVLVKSIIMDTIAFKSESELII